MEAAVRKHGKVTVPANHIEDFYARINDEKAKIVAQH